MLFFLLFPGGTQDAFERKKTKFWISVRQNFRNLLTQILWTKNLPFVWGGTGVERWYATEKEL